MSVAVFVNLYHCKRGLTRGGGQYLDEFHELFYHHCKAWLQ